jgi:alkanesulfonate monooxygenase SsuD/methylene tetrahydromethanopterin reductase-like flavin-dependent oxidoreductase (luciferase family)
VSTLEIGIGLPGTDGGPHRGRVAEAARWIEDAGLDALGVADVLTGDGTPALEAVVVLATAAAVTERVRLDFGVLAAPTRPAAMLAAQVQALQHLSGGRVRLGLGIGGFAGSPFWTALDAPSTRRGRALDELLEILPGLISGATTSVPTTTGRTDVTLAPAVPVPPILVGGSDHGAVLRRAARYGDGWVPSAITPEQTAAASARLRTLADEYGRTPPQIHVGLHAVLGDRPADRAAAARMREQLSGFFGMTREEMVDVTLSGAPHEVAERLAAYAAAGVDHVGLAFDSDDVERQIELAGEVRRLIPAARPERAPAGTRR